MRLAEMQSSRRIDTSGNPEPLTGVLLGERWSHFAAEERNTFRPTATQRKSWTLREATSAGFGTNATAQLELSRTVLRDDPENDISLRRHAVAALINSKHEDAYAAFETLAIQGIATPFDWNFYMSMAAKGISLPEKRLADIKDKLSQQPEHPYLWQLAGFWHERLDQGDEALAAYEKAAELGSKGAIYVQLARQQIAHRQFPAAQENLKLALDYHRTDQWAWIALVYLNLAMNDTKGLKDAMAQFTDFRGNTTNDYLATMLAYLDANYAHLDFGRAKAFAERSVKSNPKDVWCLTSLATVHYRLGELDAAKKRLEEAVAADEKKDAWRTWLMLAQVQHAQGAKEEALANLNKARDWRKTQPEKPTRNFDWMDRIDFDALLAEATKLIGEVPKPEVKPPHLGS